MYRCIVCGEDFWRRKKGASDALLCCSRDCGFELKRIKAAKSALVRKIAAELRGWAKPRTPGRFDRLATLRRMRARAETPCQVCGKPIGWARVKTRPASTCSMACNKQTPRARVEKRKAKLKRRALKRGVSAETFDSRAVFKRDGWLCHICGGKTRRDMAGTNHPLAPQLDHIIPLSKGGPHTRANTACSHRRCNIAKSDNIMGQPSLIP